MSAERLPPRCDRCGDLIGMYEPVVVIAGGAARDTSLAREGALVAGAVYRHHACHGDRGRADACDVP
jgi:hypothetical protein